MSSLSLTANGGATECRVSPETNQNTGYCLENLAGVGRCLAIGMEGAMKCSGDEPTDGLDGPEVPIIQE